MSTARQTRFASLLSSLLLVGCGGGPTPPPPPGGGTPGPTASSSAEPAAAPSAGPSASGAADQPPAPAEKVVHVARLEDEKAAADLPAEEAKLYKQLGAVSAKTQKAIVKSLVKVVKGCDAAALAEVKPGPGLFVAGTKPIKVSSKVEAGLRAAAQLATQRGMAVEVVSGQQSLEDVVAAYNHALLGKALELAKAASPADRKEKSFVAEARKAVGESPADGDAPCDGGRVAGTWVDVQLVAVDGAGKKGATVVKGGSDSERFTKETLESVYWEKKKGKSFRTLTEVMSVGGFMRRCDRASVFLVSSMQDGSWRCKQDTESWDPPNRPIPPWQ